MKAKDHKGTMEKTLRRAKSSVRQIFLFVIAAGAGITLFVSAEPRAEASLDPSLEKTARTYLQALVETNMATLRRLSPSRPENRFGPCPFTEMPHLHSPRVDAHRAGILFKGKTKDPELPDEGGLALTRLDGVAGNPWRVRQVAYFTELPLGARIPSRSITKKDAAQEPRVVEAARQYIAAWLKGDYKTMESLAFNWLTREQDPPPGLKIRRIEFRGKPSERGETKIIFTVKLLIFWTLPKTVEGTLFAMREDDEWRIRSNELMF
jgi:hypothetical protein